MQWIYENSFMKRMVFIYIGNENGIYTDMDGQFWDLVEFSPKLQNNLSEVVKNNFEPNINLNYNSSTRKISNANNIIKEMVKSNKLRYASIYVIDHILQYYKLALMDIYMLGRIFKKFEQKSSTDIFSESANNIIIIAGQKHIESYINFFNKIGSNILYQFSPIVERITPENRCVPMKEIEF